MRSKYLIGSVEVLLSLLLFSVPSSFAAESHVPAKKSSDANGQILDFEADVIEGQKKAPELFIQTEVQKPSIDSMLYQRKNFNDFHSVDSKRRPRMADVPRGGPAK